MNAPKAPTPPDPAQTIAAQTAGNKETAIAQTGLNAMNQVTPYGSLTYKQIGTWPDGTPRFEATTALSGDQQGLLDQQTQLGRDLNNLAIEQTGRVSGLLNQPLDLSDMTLTNTIADRYNPRLDERFARDRASLEANLANKGIKVGSAAYSNAMNDFEKQRTDAYNQILIGARNQALGETMTQRNQPLNEIIALMGGGQVQNPSFGGTPQTGIGDTDVAGIMQSDYANRYGQYQNQVNQNNAMLGGLFGLGSAALGGWAMSDPEAKTDVKKVGKVDDGINLYSFKMKKGLPGGGLRQLGVMADEVQKVDPAAVAMGPDGYRRVNYNRVMARAS